MNDAPVWPPLLAARGTFGQSARHAHHGLHVVLSVTGTVRAQVGDEPAPVTSAGIVTASNVPHALDMGDGEVLLVFLDPQSEVGTRVRGTFTGAARRLDEATRDALVHDVAPLELMQGGGVAWTARLVERLGGSAPPTRVVHPRIRRALKRLQSLPQDADDERSLRALAEAVGLSEGRFMHAFTESVGIPLRPYIAWLRVQRAVAGLAQGHPPSHVAAAVGFADAAHLSRTVKRMLGLTPTELRRAMGASSFKR